jgi:hypothetical protein
MDEGDLQEFWKEVKEQEPKLSKEEQEFHDQVDAELERVCGPCFEAVCEVCIEKRGTAGDGEPCRCVHPLHIT